MWAESQSLWAEQRGRRGTHTLVTSSYTVLSLVIIIIIITIIIIIITIIIIIIYTVLSLDTGHQGQLRRGAATNWFPIGKKFAEMGLKGRKMAENGHEMIDDGGPLVMM